MCVAEGEHTHRERQRQRDRETEREKETMRDRETETETERQRDKRHKENAKTGKCQHTSHFQKQTSFLEIQLIGLSGRIVVCDLAGN